LNDSADERPAAPANDGQSPTTDAPVIAIVEDQQAIAELLQEVLHDAGFRPMVVPSGEGAAAFVRTSGAAVVLLDVMLPERSGWHVLDELRAAPETRDIPVVVISAVYDRPGLHPLPAGGPIRFAAKPFDMASLLETVAALIQRGAQPGDD
jgi:two-component system phosphate regulon response regulator PhoB/two-component system alkaline phosphatase synthesis response regulator PhoP